MKIIETETMRKTILITGASSGFGRLTAELFQSKGWNVIATMRSPEKEVELKVLDNVLVTRLDVTDKETIKEAVNNGIGKFGGIDALVNNAGYGITGFLEEAGEGEINKQIGTNLIGVINTIQEVLPFMRKNGRGVIVNVTSLAGSVGVPMMSLYNATKFAVEGLSESLNYELKPFGIKIKTVAPGAFKTNFGGANYYISGNKKNELNDYRNKVIEQFKEINRKPPKPFGYGDPQVVAGKIYQCIVGDTPNKNMVGKDAKMIVRMRKILSKKRFFNMLYNATMPKFE